MPINPDTSNKVKAKGSLCRTKGFPHPFPPVSLPSNSVQSFHYIAHLFSVSNFIIYYPLEAYHDCCTGSVIHSLNRDNTMNSLD